MTHPIRLLAQQIALDAQVTGDPVPIAVVVALANRDVQMWVACGVLALAAEREASQRGAGLPVPRGWLN